MKITTPHVTLEGDSIEAILEKYGLDCLRDSDLRGADLRRADLRRADHLSAVHTLSAHSAGRRFACPRIPISSLYQKRRHSGVCNPFKSA